MREHTIWDNWNVDMNDWQEYLEEEYSQIDDEYEQQELVYDLLNSYLDDERVNLNIALDDEIIVIGDLGLWSGRKQGYKIIESGNISDCLYDNNCDYCRWYCDRYNMRFKGAHHDGNNYYLYRTWKENLSDEQKDNFLEKLYYGRATHNDISRYTKSLRPYVAAVYGW